MLIADPVKGDHHPDPLSFEDVDQGRRQRDAVAEQDGMQLQAEAGGQTLGVRVQAYEQVAVEARLAAGVLQLDGGKAMRDSRAHHCLHGSAPNCLVHPLARLIHVAVRAAKVARIGDVQPSRQHPGVRRAIRARGAVLGLADSVDDAMLAEPPEYVLKLIAGTGPGALSVT
jgi:hypothetical protein